MGKHYKAQIIGKVLAMRERGQTYGEIGAEYGLGSEQVRALLRRYQRNEAKRAAGIEPLPKGRPRTRNLSRAQEMELQIKRLEREVALYKSFLQAAGRR